jgi:hypothetical protein
MFGFSQALSSGAFAQPVTPPPRRCRVGSNSKEVQMAYPATVVDRPTADGGQVMV